LVLTLAGKTTKELKKIAHYLKRGHIETEILNHLPWKAFSLDQRTPYILYSYIVHAIN
jgi:hypothetical protein